MGRGSRGFHSLPSQFVRCCIVLVIVALASSCKGDFNVIVDGAPDEVVSAFFIIGDSKDLRAESGPEAIVDLVKVKNQDRYREFLEFHPDRDHGRWKLAQNAKRAAGEYYTEIFVKDGYLLAIEVHRSEFEEDENAAIAVVVGYGDRPWQKAVIMKNEFENMEQVRIRPLYDAPRNKVFEDKTTRHRENSTRLAGD